MEQADNTPKTNKASILTVPESIRSTGEKIAVHTNVDKLIIEPVE